MLLKTLFKNMTTYKDKTAFVIEEVAYTYEELAIKIGEIQQELQKIGVQKNDIIVVHTYNDLETYASILAVWFLGATFVPINPKHPKERNDLIYNQIHITCVVSSKLYCVDSSVTFINTSNINVSNIKPILLETTARNLMYILFTSGSTGVPKGVPISLGNLEAFIVENRKLFSKTTADSRFLQVYDLTFDASLQSYLLPLYIGASIYTVSPEKIKYLEAYKLMQKHQITFAKISNSIITYLKPFFSSIQLAKLQYCVFGGGEGLDLDLVTIWQQSIPNALIYNVYGPTETTVNTHYYQLPTNSNAIKNHHGIVAIGKAFGTNSAIIIDEKIQEVTSNTIGQLCLSGAQVTRGYWKDKAKNKISFFEKETNGVTTTYYKTGDLAYIDTDGDYLFCGRMDNQIKIQGYRVELAEIEHIAKQFGKASNYVAVSKKNKQEITEIVLFCEQISVDSTQLQKYLKEKLPSYMLPSQIIAVAVFPKNTNGKIDKLSLLNTN